MKTRNGFVSNSSSSSFIVNPNDLTKEQLIDILRYFDFVCGWKTDGIEQFKFKSRYNPDIKEQVKEIGLDEHVLEWTVCE